MKSTPFPISPAAVVALTVQEFGFDLDMEDALSLDAVCSRFVDDTNRAVVWLIRFRALKTWCARTDVSQWLNARGGTPQDICEVAASFALNRQWEFDAHDFGAAVGRAVSRRTRGEYSW